MRIPVESRVGNAVLGFLGVIYAVAAAALLVFEIVQTWGAMSLVDIGVALMLVVSFIGGVIFFITGARNLGLPLRRHASLPHPEAAATAR